MNERSRVLLAWLPPLAYMALIWSLSAIPRPFDLSHVPLRDKGAHLVEYALLAWLNARALRRTRPDAGWLGSALFAAGMAAGWGCLDEIHQAFVPGRDASLGDAVANLAGALFGAGGDLVLRRPWRRPA